LAVAAVVAAFLGVPVASSEWSAGPDASRPLTWTLGETLLLVAVGAVVGASVGGSGLMGLAAMLLGWPVLGFLAHRFSYWPGLIGVGISVITTLVFAGLALPGFDGWTLLEPHWETWRAWLPGSVTAGLLLSTAGLGRWAEAPAALPGHRKVPWASAGLGLLVAVAMAFGASTLAEGVLPTLVTMGFLFGLCATVAAGPTAGVRRRIGIAAVSSVWFAGPGLGGIDLFWEFLLPLGLSVTIGGLALRLQGQARWTAVIAATAALASSVFGWPGVPSGTLDAAAAAATFVGVAWIVGTRSILHRQTA
jgi:hypothetical protein